MKTLDRKCVTTATELAGYRVIGNLGVVRGITVRSRSVVGNIGAALQTLIGGNISLFAELCERARSAYAPMALAPPPFRHLPRFAGEGKTLFPLPPLVAR
jgi:hypothetical protein